MMKINTAILTILLFTSMMTACNNSEQVTPTKEEEIWNVNAPQSYPLKIPAMFSERVNIPEDNPLTIQGVELGRMLFYEKKLSGNNTMSCASCHKQEKAFSDNTRFSTGIQGIVGSKNSMSLANLLWVNRFFWNGRASSLEEQALAPIQDPIELHQSLEQAVKKLQETSIYPPKFKLVFGSEKITAQNIAKAIAQFERTLISANSKYDKYLRGEYTPTDLELKGMDLFFTHPVPQTNLRGGNCGDCHLQITTAGDRNGFRGFHNNGLDTDATLNIGLQAVTGNPNDRGKFKAPTLRNIALTAPYMHDGRFNTLEQVLEHYDQHIKMSQTLDPLIIEASNEQFLPPNTVKLFLTPQEKQAILAFLQMLTDEEFIKNPKFANPFQ
ncbi:cytochrome-c peroxidase [Thermoflexibacter ruber]|uniref:Cytochrome c peroxidase n=1 Tax=Thermoflexibacter ruber TaxID=1003 RepID=A0A1I2CST9_9BACT|nr:cytochrome c peroxidase [Thermoflexibacter ruber]SFE71381.1 cytochrome c peroxidase [Thermoflexibacter ruber]